MKGHRAHIGRKHNSEANIHSTLGLAVLLVKKETSLGGFSVQAIVNSLVEPWDVWNVFSRASFRKIINFILIFLLISLSC